MKQYRIIIPAGCSLAEIETCLNDLAQRNWTIEHLYERGWIVASMEMKAEKSSAQSQRMKDYWAKKKGRG